jgi:hypothetical protein
VAGDGGFMFSIARAASPANDGGRKAKLRFNSSGKSTLLSTIDAKIKYQEANMIG